MQHIEEVVLVSLASTALYVFQSQCDSSVWRFNLTIYPSTHFALLSFHKLEASSICIISTLGWDSNSFLFSSEVTWLKVDWRVWWPKVNRMSSVHKSRCMVRYCSAFGSRLSFQLVRWSAGAIYALDLIWWRFFCEHVILFWLSLQLSDNEEQRCRKSKNELLSEM